MSQIYGAQAKCKLDPLLQRVSWGEEVVITKYDRPINRLTASASELKKNRQSGSVEREIWVSDDVVEPLDEFEADVD